MNTKDLNKYTRDLTKITPMPKSKVRKLLKNIYWEGYIDGAFKQTALLNKQQKNK